MDTAADYLQGWLNGDNMPTEPPAPCKLLSFKRPPSEVVMAQETEPTFAFAPPKPLTVKSVAVPGKGRGRKGGRKANGKRGLSVSFY